MLPLTKKIEQLQAPLTELRVRDHLAGNRLEEAKKLAPQLRNIEEARLALLQLDLGDSEKAIKTARAFADKGKKQVQPQALLAYVLWKAGQKVEAQEVFKAVRELAAEADRTLPALDRLSPLAEAAGLKGDWRALFVPATDTGERPPLDSLGPIEWHPWPAATWTAVNKEGQPVTGESLKGKPHVVILFLGNACVHCSAQLKAFSDKAAVFEKAGLPVVAISTDAPADIAASTSAPPFPVYSGADTLAFKALDAWDDFENKPLHATCYIDASGRMAWQHVSYEPFMLPDFLLEEIKRLQSLDKPPVQIAGAVSN